MTYILKMNEEEAALLIKLLANKVKEIHAWQAATKDYRRQEEKEGIQSLLKNIHTKEEAE